MNIGLFLVVKSCKLNIVCVRDFLMFIATKIGENKDV